MADSNGITGAPNGANGSSEESSSLDHALLESLFYNEMMMMDDSSLSTHFLSSLTSDGTPEASAASSLPDPSTLVEKDLLRRFGVSGSPMTKPQHAEWASTSAPSGVHQETLPPVPDLPEPPEINTNAPPPIAASHPPVAAPVASRLPVTPTRGQGIIHSVTSVPPAAAPISEEEKRKKLVSQFATLASRLGIALPPQIIQSLTAAEKATLLPGGHSAPQFVPSATDLAANQRNGQLPPHQQPFATTVPSSNFQPQPPVPPIKPTPAVQQLQSTAEAAVAAVTQNRKRAVEEGSNSDGGGAKPAYSKRRKKPRLVDCENNLAQLKAENEMLKRHLANVSSQSHNFDQERAEAEQRMRTMLENNAGPEQLDEVVKNFTELYSDYGRRRHQELTFHLEQLQRLASPTNFTKMGLWTLGQQSKDPKRNPIAGILQKELGINAQQGRKILDQRQKIRDVCSNLKECLILLGKLKALCEQKTKIFHDRMSKCREILAPRQVVKLLIWIDEHSEVLGSVCPGWGSEHIHSSKAPPKQS